MKEKIRVLWTMAMLACAVASDGQQSIQAQAPEALEPMRIGSPRPNRFRHELYHGEQCLLHSPGRPVKRGLLSSLDTPSLRNLDFIVTDGQSFAERAQDSPTSTRLANPRLGRRKHGDDAESLTYQIVNTDTLNRWRLTMTYVTDPSPPTLLISVEFTSLNGLALPADGQMRSRMAFDQTPTPGLLAELGYIIESVTAAADYKISTLAATS